MAIKIYNKKSQPKYKYSKNGVFPAKIAGNISCFSFSESNPSNSNFQDQLVQIVNLSSNVEILSSYSFNGCYKLNKVNLGTSLKTIGEFCFSGCHALETIEIPASIQEIDSNAFSSMRHLDLLTFNYFDSDGQQLTSK